jgi:DNA-binding Xre family transcriptional regulator
MSMNNVTDKVVIGRRPKQKDATTEQIHTSASLSTLASVKRICANPLDRMCELLLDWEISSFAASKNSEDVPPEFAKLPLNFQHFHEYVTLWEPLMIEEMKENVKSNYRTKSAKELKKGHFSFKSSDRLPHITHTLEAAAVPASGSASDPDK